MYYRQILVDESFSLKLKIMKENLNKYTPSYSFSSATVCLKKNYRIITISFILLFLVPRS